MEVYVDDMLVKSIKDEKYTTDLREAFDWPSHDTSTVKSNLINSLI